MRTKFLLKISLLCGLVTAVVFGAVLVVLNMEWRQHYITLKKSQAETMAQTLLRMIELQDAEQPIQSGALQEFSDRLSEECQRLYDLHNVSADGYIALLAHDGAILAHNDRSRVSTKIHSQPLLNELGWRESRFLGNEGLHHLLLPVVSASGADLATVDIALSGTVYAEEFERRQAKLLGILLPALVVIVGGEAAIIFWFVVKPLTYLTGLGWRITQGSFIAGTQFAGRNDIFSRLGDVFVDFSLYLQEVTELAQNIACGKLDCQDIQKRSKRDLLGIALHEMLDYLRMVTDSARKISEGDLRIRIPIRADTDQFGRTLNQMMTYLHKMADVATAISTGDLREEILPRSEQDALGHAFYDMTAYLRRLSSAAATIAAGDLQQNVTPATDNDVLGNAFHAMAIQLRENFEKIQQEIAERTRAQEALQQLNETLEQRVEKRTAEVTRQKYILDSFMENVPDNIYFKDLESRFIQVNTAHAKFFGFNDPAELVGKNDFDFFPEELAGPRYEKEQEIIRSGNPLFALEEIDIEGRWSLTTKMPLRNEHGEIIGTFGISRDITEIKQAQQQLEDAYHEIRTLHDKLKDENLRMSAELDVGRRLQKMVLPLPEELQQIENLDIAGFMRPADEVGGDYYDVLPCQNGQLCLGIGDVTGHGLESGVLMLMTQTAIRTLITLGRRDPTEFLSIVNQVLYKNVQRMGVDKSLTLSFGRYHNGTLTLAGQHEELLVVRRDGQVERVDTSDLGFPIGMVEDITEWVAETTVSLEPGDGIVLYTDGITEAENSEKKLYGLDRLCTVLTNNWHTPAESIQKAVIEDVITYIGEQTVFDDLTLVVMKQQ